MAESERRGCPLEVQLICRVKGPSDPSGRHAIHTLGELISLSCPNAASARYIRRRLDELARELDGALVLPDEVQPRKR